ncbi:acyl-CoA synthetase [Arthrobacter ramosus]|uniref:Acyl-CoA synthetase n=1 Tax=Arthrobacter ramosus TaxID=1672 RepID=A0ABV5Y4J7_ARTRM|nr:acyl-CoA synthetase [Arthrobacter ramosus]
MYPGAHAALTPDKPAFILVESGETLTYQQLEDRSARLAQVLFAAGLRPGDTVAMLAHNSPLYYEVYWAAMRSGLYMTPVNAQLSSTEIAYIVNDCDAKAFVVAADFAAVIAEVLPLIQVRLLLASGGAIDGFDDLEEALAAAPEGPLDHEPRGREMVYSSGTTGLPKGVQAPLPPYLASEGSDPLLGVFGPIFGWDSDSIYLNPAPLYHGAPLRFGGMIHSVGGTVVSLRKFDAETALQTIERYAVTHSQWVPTMFVRLLKLPAEVRAKYDLSSHRVAVHAAAPCAVEVKAGIIEWWGPILFEYYSSTEAIGITFTDSATWAAHPGTVGKAGLGILHICDDEGNELDAFEDGIVYFERDVMPFAYHNAPDKTRAAQHPANENWSSVGDIGHVDDEGFLFLTDRVSFMIIAGGVNIYPQEVENALALHDAVFDIAVIGVPDAEMGQRVHGVVQLEPDHAASPELERELIEFLRARIAHYKVPRRIDFWDTLPRNAMGKMLKREVLATYIKRTVAE